MLAKNKMKKIDTDENNKKPEGFFRRFFTFSSSTARRLYIFIISLGLVVATLSYVYAPDIGIELGGQSPRTIKANKGS